MTKFGAIQVKQLRAEVSSLQKQIKKLQRIDPEKEMEKTVDARVRSTVGNILPPDKVRPPLITQLNPTPSLSPNCSTFRIDARLHSLKCHYPFAGEKAGEKCISNRAQERRVAGG